MQWDALLQGVAAGLSVNALLGVCLGVVLGTVIGIIPGLTGTLGIVLLLPFIWGMDPVVAFAILLSLVSSVHTSNTFPAFFFNVPGSPSAAATVLDGYPMARKGEAARGLTAAFAASALGGILGAVVLFALLPVLRPFVLQFASPERFMLVMVGVVLIGVSGGRNPLKGLIVGAFGLWLGTIGQDPQFGLLRFTFGQDYLLEGIPLVALVLGLFALPEVISLAIRGQIAEKTAVDMGTGFLPGLRATVQNWWLVVKSSLVGVVAGGIPGLGGTAAAFYAYSLALQSAKPADREKFGKGEIRGVIAPESANNASFAGELIPLLAFAVPGGATSAVLLVAFLVLGITPGPDMLHSYLWLSYTLVFFLVVSNIIATAICIGLTRWARHIAWVKGSLIIPIVLLFTLFGSYAALPHPGTLLVVLGFGLIGYLMMRWEWSRVPLLLGFILGPLAENNLFISLATHGGGFLLRPIPLVLLALMALIVVLGFLRWRRSR